MPDIEKSLGTDAPPQTPPNDTKPLTEVVGDTTPDPLDAEYEYKADGTVRKEPLRKIIERAQKAIGAEEALRRAAEARKEVEGEKARVARADELEALLDGFKNRDQGAFRKLSRELGLSDDNPDLTDALWEALTEDLKPAGESKGATGKPKQETSTPIDPSLLKRIQKFFSDADEMGVDPATAIRTALGGVNRSARQEVQGLIEKSLTGDPFFGTILPKKSAEVQQALLDRIYNGVEGRVNAKQELHSAIKETIAQESKFFAALAPAGGSEHSPEPPFTGVGRVPTGHPQAPLHPGKTPKVDPTQFTKPGGIAEYADRVLAETLLSEE